MKGNSWVIFIITFLFYSNLTAQVWSTAQAQQWVIKNGWRVGCNYIPATAVNPIEMWQAETFDTATISKELALAHSIGFNTIRVFLHETVYRTDSINFKRRVALFLDIAAHYNIKVIPVLFDDCWFHEPQAGPQPAPRPGVHNSEWVMCPGKHAVTHSDRWPDLKKYVQDIISTFRNDNRVLFWDVYNEPGNSLLLRKTNKLLKATFEWARAAGPSQPLSSGVYAFKACRKIQLKNSDIITFHSYDKLPGMQRMVNKLKKYGRPLVCTEYMCRPTCTFANALPYLAGQNVGAINWGLVSGKTQTIYPWSTWMKPMNHEPDPWFHDIFRPDYTPYNIQEVELIKKYSIPLSK